MVIFFLEFKSKPSSISALTLECFICILRKKNSKWTETTIVISDKDFTERLVFNSEMPQINMQICLLHVLRTFGREMTTKKANITPEQRLKLLELLQRITCAKTEAEYIEKQSKLNQFGRSVETYFNQNWPPIRQEWCEAYKRPTLSQTILLIMMLPRLSPGLCLKHFP